RRHGSSAGRALVLSDVRITNRETPRNDSGHSHTTKLRPLSWRQGAGARVEADGRRYGPSLRSFFERYAAPGRVRRIPDTRNPKTRQWLPERRVSPLREIRWTPQEHEAVRGRSLPDTAATVFQNRLYGWPGSPAHSGSRGSGISLLQ